MLDIKQFLMAVEQLAAEKNIPKTKFLRPLNLLSLPPIKKKIAFMVVKLKPS